MNKQASLHIRFASLNLMGIEVSLVSQNSTLNTCTYVMLDNNCTLEAQIFEAFFVCLLPNTYLVKPNSDVLIRLEHQY